MVLPGVFYKHYSRPEFGSFLLETIADLMGYRQPRSGRDCYRWQ